MRSYTAEQRDPDRCSLSAHAALLRLLVYGFFFVLVVVASILPSEAEAHAQYAISVFVDDEGSQVTDDDFAAPEELDGAPLVHECCMASACPSCVVVCEFQAFVTRRYHEAQYVAAASLRFPLLTYSLKRPPKTLV